MLDGTTKSGFKFNISDETLDDWELLEGLAEIDNGNVAAIITVYPRLLGVEQFEKLKEHCRENGKIRVSKMQDELMDIMSQNNKTKNSYSSPE